MSRILDLGGLAGVGYSDEAYQTLVEVGAL